MFSVDDMRAKIAKGYEINKSEAMQLAKEKNVVLSNMAADIQKQYGQLRFEFCSIINAKSGACSEDCKFCAQSAVYNTGSPVYGFVERDIIIDKARICAEKGISRFSIVTSGKNPL
jgi:biotin synthase